MINDDYNKDDPGKSLRRRCAINENVRGIIKRSFKLR